MAEIIVMPALGNTVESCLVTTWLVAEGDTVDENTVLCEIETDKSAMDVPAGTSGTVLKLLAEEGDEVPVKAPLLIVGEPGEDISGLAGAEGVPTVTGEAGEVDETVPDKLAPEAPADDKADAPASTAPVAASAPATGMSPRARGLAERSGLPLDAVAEGTGPHGRVIERDVQAALESGRTTVGARGQDASGVQGTGIGGRVSLADLERKGGFDSASGSAQPAGVAGSAQPAGVAGSAQPVRAFPGAYTDVPLKGVRKLIADRMLHALASSAQLTYTATAPAKGMLALRKRFKNSAPELGFTGITLGDMVCFATVQVLKKYAALNAHLTDGVLREFESVHLGLAVDTPRGLLVPTIRNADSMSLREISAKTKELAEAARSGKIDPDLLAGATFTVSNLGSFGIEHFTPIINVPQTGILGVNTITPRATINPDGTPGVEQRIGFSLTADHQVVDGADAGRFLKDLCAAIADIDLTVMG